MFVLSNLINAIAYVLKFVLDFYVIVIIASAILSWIKPKPDHPLIQSIIYYIYQLTDPVYRKLRKILPSILYQSGIDWTPLILLIVIQFINLFIVQSLFDLSFYLKHSY